MANSQAILDKIARNLQMRGIPAASIVRGQSSVSLTKTGGDVLTISYTAKAVQSPMGGVSPASSPYLGAGIAAPGTLKVKGASGETTIAGIFDTVEALELMHELAGYANDVVVESGSTTAELARIRGHESLVGMGS